MRDVTFIISHDKKRGYEINTDCRFTKKINYKMECDPNNLEKKDFDRITVVLYMLENDLSLRATCHTLKNAYQQTISRWVYHRLKDISTELFKEVVMHFNKNRMNNKQMQKAE